MKLHRVLLVVLSWRFYSSSLRMHPSELEESRTRSCWTNREPQVPFPGRFTEIFFSHNRKAGGSTVRHWLKAVAWYHNITFSWQEGKRFDASLFHRHPNTFFITNLRDPVERALSEYDYQGRWGAASNMNRTTETAIPLRQWISDRNRHGKHWWSCASECFTRWYSGSTILHQRWAPSAADAGVAESVMLRHNLVVIMEQLRDPGYRCALMRTLNVSEANLPIVKRSAFLDKEQHQYTEPYNISEEDRAYLAERNTYDLRLYKHVRDYFHL